jgi:MFS family permease
MGSSLNDDPGILPGLPDPVDSSHLRAEQPDADSGPPLPPLWRQPNFAKLWVGEGISQFGAHLSALALPLIAATMLGASPFEVGLLAALGWLPYLLVGLVAGAWSDRVRRRPLLIAADLGRAFLFALIPLAWLLGHLGMPVLYAVALTAGTLTVFFDVANLAYLPTLVDRRQLVDANGKISATASAAQIAGPGLGGVLVRLIGAPLTVLFDACSFLLSAIAIWRIDAHEPEPAPRAAARSLRAEIGEGLRTVRGSEMLRALVFASGTVQFAGYAFLSIYVLYMTRDLGLNASQIGLVFSIGGAGALAGAFLANPLRRRIGHGPAIVFTMFMFGITGLLVPLAVLAPAIALPMVVASEFLQWMAIVAYDVNAVSFRQAIVPDRLAGRVNGTMRFFTSGLRPVGSLAGGILGGSALGLAGTLAVTEFGMLLAFVWLLFSPLRSAREPVPLPDPSLA